MSFCLLNPSSFRKISMLSQSSQKTYNYYLNCYHRWCLKNQIDEHSGLDAYKDYLQTVKRSDAYIRNSIHVIAKKKNIPVLQTFVSNKSTEKFNSEEIKLLKNVCRRNFKSEEISLLLLILLETTLKMKDVLKLSKLDIHNILSKKETIQGKKIPQDTLYIFEYLLSISLQKEAQESFFTKTYHCYLHKFKIRQKDLFPNKPYRSFNAIHTRGS